MSPSQRIFRTAALIMAVTLQVIVLSNAQSSAASGAVLFDECSQCEEGEKCMERENGTKYCKSCVTDCSNHSIEIICASDGKTYQNLCEMQVSACEQERELKVEHNNKSCRALPPIPESICKKKQEEIDSVNHTQFNRHCDLAAIMEKSRMENLTYYDLNVDYCHRPSCRDNDYTAMQCFSYINWPKWCWCSNSDGTPIESTFQHGLSEEVCTQRQQCQVGSIRYSHESTFLNPNPNKYGPCQCLNGVQKCYETLTFNVVNNTLDESELLRLREEILRIFYMQFIHQRHSHINHIHYADLRSSYNVVDLSESFKRSILNFKYTYFDTNKDDVLQSSELFVFGQELNRYIRCNTIYDIVIKAMNTTNDPDISNSEWIAFFAEPQTQDDEDESTGALVKRDTEQMRGLPRKPLSQRSKFYYTLS